MVAAIIICRGKERNRRSAEDIVGAQLREALRAIARHQGAHGVDVGVMRAARNLGVEFAICRELMGRQNEGGHVEMDDRGFPTTEGDKFSCPGCGAGYVASWAAPRIADKDSSRCKNGDCRLVMISWRCIGLRLVSLPSRRDDRQ